MALQLFHRIISIKGQAHKLFDTSGQARDGSAVRTVSSTVGPTRVWIVHGSFVLSACESTLPSFILITGVVCERSEGGKAVMKT
jgi:hypothetical protein